MDLNLYLKQLETLVNIDSGSHNAAGVNKVADVIEGWYRDLGWHSEAEYADFYKVYGFDITAWKGYPLYKQIRELRMTTWLAQKGGENPEIDAEIDRRVNDLAHPERPREWNPY